MTFIVPTFAELKLKRQLFKRVRKLRKTIITFVMSVCLSVRMEQRGSHLMDVPEI